MRPYFECPSYYCKDCGYRQGSPGRCPFCDEELIGCSYKSETFTKDFVCPLCQNGEVMVVKNPEVKRKIEPLFDDMINKIDKVIISSDQGKGISRLTKIEPVDTDYFQKGKTFTKDSTPQDVCGSKPVTPSAIDRLRKFPKM